MQSRNRRIDGSMKKKTLAELKKELWEFCKKIVRKIHPNVCYTCGRAGLQGSDWQSGHGKPKGALPLKYQYDLRNLRPQCLRCNLHYGGCSDIFIAKLEREKDGKAFLKESCVRVNGRWEIKREPPMGSIEAWMFVNSKIEEYKRLI